jgi:hypothetical protein
VLAGLGVAVSVAALAGAALMHGSLGGPEDSRPQARPPATTAAAPQDNPPTHRFLSAVVMHPPPRFRGRCNFRSLPVRMLNGHAAWTSVFIAGTCGHPDDASMIFVVAAQATAGEWVPALRAALSHAAPLSPNEVLARDLRKGRSVAVYARGVTRAELDAVFNDVQVAQSETVAVRPAG